MPRSIVASLLSGGSELIVLLPLVEMVHLNYLVAVGLSMIVAQSVLFVLNKYWAFEALRGTTSLQYMRHAVLAAGTFVGNLVLTFVFKEWLKFHYLVAFLLASGVVFACWGYPGSRIFVFADSRAPRLP